MGSYVHPDFPYPVALSRAGPRGKRSLLRAFKKAISVWVLLSNIALCLVSLYKPVVSLQVTPVVYF